jgi:hypothetical protein
MRKIYGCFLILIFAPAIIFVYIFVYSYFSERRKTWFCKDINMCITIVDKHSDHDMIILNKSDTIFTSSDFGRTLCGVELHFKEHNIWIKKIFTLAFSLLCSIIYIVRTPTIYLTNTESSEEMAFSFLMAI